MLALLAVLEVRIGIMLLAAFSGSTAAGIYSAADRLMLPVLLVQSLMIRATYPALLRLWTEDRIKMHEVASRCLRFVLFCSIPLSGLAFVLRDVAPLVFGNQFDASVAPLTVVAWLPIVAGLRSLWHFQAVAAKLERQATAITAIAVGLLVAAALFTTPRQGAVGLAIAVVAAETVHAVLLYALLAQHRMRPAVARFALGPACAVGLAIVCSLAIGESGLAILAVVSTSATVAGLWLFGGVRLDDLRFVLSLFRGAERGAKEPLEPE